MSSSDNKLWRLEGAPDATQDRPIEQECDDLLDRAPFVGSLARALVKDIRDNSGNLVARQATGFVIGLTGSWGLGKSSVLNLLTLHLSSQEKVIVAYFNPWLFKGRDELLTAFFNSLAQAVGRTKTEDARRLIDALDRYRRSIELTAHVVAAGIDLLGASGAASAVTKAGLKFWQKKEPTKPPPDPVQSILEERKRLEAKLKKLDSAVVVLIDELDRVEDDDVRAVAQLVKAVGDIRGISYLVAYDPKRVADALGRGIGKRRIETGHAYLEKIIQHPIPMRPLFVEDVDRLIEGALAAHTVDIPESDPENDRAILDLLREQLKTPREIKRLIGSFAVIEEATRGEVNPTHVLAYCWILTKSPDLQTRIAAELEKFVDDPSQNEMFRRAARERGNRREDVTSEEFLGSAAKSFEPLLRKLFPRFGQDPNNVDGTRISRRRNLVRVLYLGNPPGMVTRQTIEDVWGMPESDIEHDLARMLQNGGIAEFLDRFDDLLPKLPESGDNRFWSALSRILTRQSDWVNGPEPRSSIIDDASTSLFRLAMRDRASAPRVMRILHDLIISGDLVIVPWILRKHMFLYGLVEGQPARHGDAVYDEAQTRELVERELPRYRQALLDGTLLRRVPNVEALFALKNGGAWDSELFQSLTEQLSTPEAIYTIATLFTPPGQIVERETIAEFANIEHVISIVASLPIPEDPWVAQSFKRFKLTVEGQDPFFNGEDLAATPDA